jgi:hypothetical protein
MPLKWLSFLWVQASPNLEISRIQTPIEDADAGVEDCYPWKRGRVQMSLRGGGLGFAISRRTRKIWQSWEIRRRGFLTEPRFIRRVCLFMRDKYNSWIRSSRSALNKEDDRGIDPVLRCILANLPAILRLLLDLFGRSMDESSSSS